MMTAVRQEAFDKLDREYIRVEAWTDVDLFAFIGNMATVDPVFAAAIAFHARDVLAESSDDIDYTDLVAEVYRRTIFDPVHAVKYGTDHLAGPNGERLMHFVDFMLIQKTCGEANAKNVIPFAPPHRM